MEIPAQEHAGMTEEVHAWVTVKVYAGMTVYFRPRNYTLSSRPMSRDLLIALTQPK